MKPSIQIIELTDLSVAFIPALFVLFVVWRWRLNAKTALYGMFRMLVQLLLVGYFLVYIFAADSSPVVLAVLMVMLLASSWIALRTVPGERVRLYTKSFIANFLGGALVLMLVSQWVLKLDPWYLPQYLIPLAGMIFANSMNSISLAAERYSSELSRGESPQKARNIAFEASIIPITNSLFAVGIVSLPGMMTGQILSGVSPFIAARYQIMVMAMLFGSTGIASAIFLTIAAKDFKSQQAHSQE